MPEAKREIPTFDDEWLRKQKELRDRGSEAAAVPRPGPLATAIPGFLGRFAQTADDTVRATANMLTGGALDKGLDTLSGTTEQQGLSAAAEERAPLATAVGKTGGAALASVPVVRGMRALGGTLPWIERLAAGIIPAGYERTVDRLLSGEQETGADAAEVTTRGATAALTPLAARAVPIVGKPLSMMLNKAGPIANTAATGFLENWIEALSGERQKQLEERRRRSSAAGLLDVPPR